MYHRGPTVHRGARGCAEDVRAPECGAPQPPHFPMQPPPATPAPTRTTTSATTDIRLEVVPRRRAGGGGAGCTKPSRADYDALMHAQLHPVGKAALMRAHTMYRDPETRLIACQYHLRTGTYRPRCPLSPVKSRPCSQDECKCNLSHYQLELTIPLDSAKQASRNHSACCCLTLICARAALCVFDRVQVLMCAWVMPCAV